MRHLSSNILFSIALGTVLALVGASYTITSQASDPSKSVIDQQAATANIQYGYMDFDIHVEAQRAILRVSGPEGYAMTTRIEKPEFITVDLVMDAGSNPQKRESLQADTASWKTLPDGPYNYELMIYTPDGQRHTIRGKFDVVDGTTIPRDRTLQPSISDDALSAASESENWLQSLASATLDILIPSAAAQSGDHDEFVIIRDADADNNTRINFVNTDHDNAGIQYLDGDLHLVRGTGPNFSEFLMTFSQLGKVGIGTTSPGTNFHVNDPADNFAAIRVSNTENSWDMSASGSSGFQITQFQGAFTTDNRPFRIEPEAPTSSMHIAANGDVGLGTSSPGVNLDIVDSGRAAVGINAGTDQQADFTLATGGTARWVFRARAASNNFEIARRDASGGFLDVPLLIPHSDGVTQIRNGLTHIPTSTPSAPGAGGTLFVDSADGDLKVRFSNGTVKTIATN